MHCTEETAMKQIPQRVWPVGFNYRILALFGLGLILFMVMLPAPAAERSGSDFNHLSTGFPLTGAHAQASCETCHARGVFKGTPRQCIHCHTQGSRMASSTKPPNHVSTSQPCDQCHTSTVSWAGARYSHSGIVPGTCMTCHNGTTAQGKSANHVQTTSSCDSCHRTTAWLPAGFNHVGITPGTCATCHNGTTATGKHARHIPTTASCDTCHQTRYWVPVLGNASIHASVAPGSCVVCHGITATGKPARHVTTTASCDACHRTTAWTPATFSHAGVVAGSCAGCHNGTTAIGKGSGHFVTTRSCDACHSIPTTSTPTGNWPARYSIHTSPYYVAHSASINNNCASCHGTPSTETISRLTKYSPVPTCYGCHAHANSYRSDPHGKTENPSVKYSAVELHNCSGSCHFYQNTVGGTLQESRPGPRHTPTNGRGMR